MPDVIQTDGPVLPSGVRSRARHAFDRYSP